MSNGDYEPWTLGVPDPGPRAGASPALPPPRRSLSPLERAQSRIQELEASPYLSRVFGGRAEIERLEKGLPTLIQMEQLKLAEQRERRADRGEALKLQTEALKAEKEMLDQYRQYGAFLRDTVVKEYRPLSEADKKAARPVLVKVFQKMAEAAGFKFDPADIDSSFSIEGFAERGMATLDPLATSEERQHLGQELAATTKAEERDKIYARYATQIKQRAQVEIHALLPTIAQIAGASPEKPIGPAELGETVREVISPDLLKSEVLMSEFAAYIKDPKNAGTLESIGVRAPATVEAQARKRGELTEETRPEVTAAKAQQVAEIERQKRLAMGPDLGQPVKDILAGEGLTPATATAAQIEAARVKDRKQSLDERLQVAKQTGVDAAKIAEDRKQNEPLDEKAPFWIHPETGQAAAPSLSRREAKDKGFKPVTEGGMTAVATARAGLAQIAEYRQLVTRLYPTRTGNTIRDLANVQANRAWLTAQHSAGNPDVRRLFALHGSIATLARATGDTANVAVAEREMLKSFVLTSAETQESATEVLDQAERILRSVVESRGVPLGQGLPKKPPRPAPANPKWQKE